MRIREELQTKGYCILRNHFAAERIEACREAFWPVLLDHMEHNEPNRGPHRYFCSMPFTPPCFAPEFFFDPVVLGIARGVMDDRIVADQWGCDAPVLGSIYQEAHVDYQRPLFGEAPGMPLPTYMLVISFGLVRIASENGPIEIAPGTHRMPRLEALAAVKSGAIGLEPVLLDVGDVLIRHPWALHRGTPNLTDIPRAFVTIRYVRRWFADSSRDVNAIPLHVWNGLTSDQQAVLRFPLAHARGLEKITLVTEPRA